MVSVPYGMVAICSRARVHTGITSATPIVGTVNACKRLIGVGENPLTRGEKVIAHVLASNNAPRGLIERALRFQLVRRDSYPSKDLPGLPVNAQGMVEGDLFTMTNDSLRALAEWCTPAPATLRDGRPLNIELGNEHSFEIFAAALSQMSM